MSGYVAVFVVCLILVILSAQYASAAVLSDPFKARCCNPHFSATIQTCEVYSEGDAWCAMQTKEYASALAASNVYGIVAFLFAILGTGAWQAILILKFPDQARVPYRFGDGYD